MYTPYAGRRRVHRRRFVRSCVPLRANVRSVSKRIFTDTAASKPKRKDRFRLLPFVRPSWTITSSANDPPPSSTRVARMARELRRRKTERFARRISSQDRARNIHLDTRHGCILRLFDKCSSYSSLTRARVIQILCTYICIYWRDKRKFNIPPPQIVVFGLSNFFDNNPVQISCNKNFKRIFPECVSLILNANQEKKKRKNVTKNTIVSKHAGRLWFEIEE